MTERFRTVMQLRNTSRIQVIIIDALYAPLMVYDLLKDHRSSKHMAVCQGCSDGDGTIWGPNSEEHLGHLVEENVFHVCESHFDSPENFKHVGRPSIYAFDVLMMYIKHKVTHMERNIECYGCYRKFKTFSHITLYLETGTCESHITSQDLNMTATQCYQEHKYAVEDRDAGG